MRPACPIGDLCRAASDDDEGESLLPAVVEVGKDEYIWTNMKYDDRVLVVRNGVFAYLAHAESGEPPLALFGRGVAVGLAELYAPIAERNEYYLRSIIPGTVCSVPMEALRKKIEAIPLDCAQRMVCRALLGQSAAAFMQTRVVSQRTTRDRILALFLYLRYLTGKSDSDAASFELTHDEIAILISSDRASVTRALHKMKIDGVLSLGYGTVTVNYGALHLAGTIDESLAKLYRGDGSWPEFDS